MNEYDLIEFIDFEILNNNLMESKTKTSDERSDESTINPTKNEDLIVQMLMDKCKLEMNTDKRFVNKRIIYYFDINFIREKDNKIIENYFEVKKGGKMKILFKVNDESLTQNLDYEIQTDCQKVYIKRLPSKPKNEEIQVEESNKEVEEKEKSIELKSIKSDTHSLSEEQKTYVSSSSKGQKAGCISTLRTFLDKIGDENYHVTIIQKHHEVDGYLITNKNSTFNNELKNLLFYPDLEGNIEIKEDQKILIEAKQNVKLDDLYKQMEKLMKDFKKLLPLEKFYYFAFLNENKRNDIDQKNNFKQKIDKYLTENENFKVYVFIIKDNQFYDLKLEDKADYSLHFRNEVKNEIKEMKSDVSTLKIDVSTLKTDVSFLKVEITDVKQKIDKILEFLQKSNEEKFAK